MLVARRTCRLKNRRRARCVVGPHGALECHAVTKKPTRAFGSHDAVPIHPRPDLPARPALPLVKYRATRRQHGSAQAASPPPFFSSLCSNVDVIRIIRCIHTAVGAKSSTAAVKSTARPGLPVHSGEAPLTAACPGIGPANPGCQANRV